MVWNEPGRDKDPWGGDKRPEDLEQLLRVAQKRIRDFFGGYKDGGQRPFGGAAWLWLVVLLLGAWMLSGIYTVDSAERAVVLRFGDYEYTARPGLHWHLPWPIETNDNVNVDAIQPYNYQASMLTQDENIIDVALAVQYRVDNPKKYLFQVRNPRMTLSEVTDSALREVVGAHDMNFILGAGRGKIAEATEKLLQTTLNDYDAGLKVTSVNLQQAAPPKQVRGAFDDVKKASEDKQRRRNLAQSYANDILPKARGQAVREIQQARAYKSRTIANAKGDASRFDQLLAAYKRAPRVTRKRLYLDTMQTVLGNTRKVIVSAQGSNKLLYLPLDQLLKGNSSASGQQNQPKSNGAQSNNGSVNSNNKGTRP